MESVGGSQGWAGLHAATEDAFNRNLGDLV